jgi:peptidoglycan/xylan/chitin deacetylase (PgdA/CDA1 family)
MAKLRFVLMMLVVASLVQAGSAQTVAITFDDLPFTGGLPDGVTRVEVAQSILQTLKAVHAPRVYGMVNAKRVEGNPVGQQILKMWVAAGYPLGNHTWAHPFLTDIEPSDFERQVLDDEPVLRAFSKPGEDWHWFRYPYLQEGETVEKQQIVAAWLKDHNYRIAQVTMDFDDYAWNDPLTRCIAKHDDAALETLKAMYMQDASVSIDYDRKLSQMLYHRDIPYVVMLHMGAIERLMLPQFFALLKQKGFTLTTLEKAESDPAYKDDPAMGSKFGGTMLEQVFLSRHMELPPYEKPLAKLSAMCR